MLSRSEPMKIILAAVAAFALAISPALAQSKAKGKAAAEAKQAAAVDTGTKAGIDTAARNAFVIDYQTGAVLLEKTADERMPPASMRS